MLRVDNNFLIELFALWSFFVLWITYERISGSNFEAPDSFSQRLIPLFPA